MRIRNRTVSLLLAALAATAAAPAQSFVVANRGSGELTVHRASDGLRTDTVPLPAAANPPEPMYVVQVGSEVVVGDRGNDRIVRFGKQRFDVRGELVVGAGVFHMWGNGRQLWVNCDVDLTTAVVDTATWQVVRKVPIPADLSAQGYRPHDVFAGPDFAWVSLLGGSGATDWIVQVSAATFAETGRAAVGKDPHLWWDRAQNRLYVPAQGSNRIDVLDATTMQPVQTVPQPGAHGVFLPPLSRTLLVTNFAGGGADDLIALRHGDAGLTEAARVSTNVPSAHNIAALPFGLRVAVTHSSPTSTKVSFYRLTDSPWLGPARLTRLGDVDAGLNPFGLAVVH